VLTVLVSLIRYHHSSLQIFTENVYIFLMLLYVLVMTDILFLALYMYKPVV